MVKLTIALAVCALAAWSQETSKVQAERAVGFGPVGITAALAGPLSTVAGAPYSAQAVTERVQVLADGNRITQTSTNSVARDSKGRVRREESLPGAVNGANDGPRLVLIEDPVAGVHITLDSTTKTAMRMTGQGAKRHSEIANMGPGMPPPPMPPLTLSVGPGDGGPFQIITSDTMKIEPNQTGVTDLGTQTIEGVPAKGKRITHTIPAGEIGNEQPLVITTETWYSPDLKVTLMSKSSDPRMGETTYRLTNLSRVEPDAALFQVPADYTVKDHGQDVFFIKTDHPK